MEKMCRGKRERRGALPVKVSETSEPTSKEDDIFTEFTQQIVDAPDIFQLMDFDTSALIPLTPAAPNTTEVMPAPYITMLLFLHLLLLPLWFSSLHPNSLLPKRRWA